MIRHHIKLPKFEWLGGTLYIKWWRLCPKEWKNGYRCHGRNHYKECE